MTAIRERLADIHGELVMCHAALEGLTVLNDYGPTPHRGATPSEARASNALVGTLELLVTAHARAVESLDDVLITMQGEP